MRRRFCSTRPLSTNIDISDNNLSIPSDTPQTCTSGAPAKCSDITNFGYICSSATNTYHTKTTCIGHCYICDDGWQACGADKATACEGHTPSGTIYTSGGFAGKRCDTAQYAPDCTRMLRCSATGIIKSFSCGAKTCVVNKNGSCQRPGVNSCDATGHYSTSVFPTGYFECV